MQECLFKRKAKVPAFFFFELVIVVLSVRSESKSGHLNFQVTQPTEQMRSAMSCAVVGDDVFGDDPTVNALQEKIAEILGFESALFLPTGTQSNLCAILSHCQRGDEYIVGQMAHCYRWEGGGAAVFGSVQPQPLNHKADGTIALEDIEAAIKPDDAHFARTRLLALENTFGGKLIPFDYIQEATTLAKTKGLSTHLDGARLFNAAVAQAAELSSDPRSEARRIAQCFDSVSVCFSKGLGAPAGSALCGSRDLIARAHRIRKMAGGGMRQAGILAAAAIYALDHNVDRLADDHANAQRLSDALAGVDGLTVGAPNTNILFADLMGPARERLPELVAFLAKHGVRVLPRLPLRLVTHLNVDAAGIDRAAGLIRNFLANTAT